MSEAIVVGAGPNGLVCAALLARAGVRVTVLEAQERIGGGTTTSELTLPGLLHDDCSAVHVMAVGAPSLSGLGLERHGLQWCWPEVDLAHPLDGGSAGVVLRCIEDTARGLGEDGRTWERIFGAPARGFGGLSEDIMRPILHVPRHPLRLARFGLPAATPATLLARKFRTEQARALWGGCAAHAFRPLTQPMTSSVGMALICAGHAYGWPVARGGSRAISDALAAVVEGARRADRDRPAGELAGRASGGRRCRARPRARRGRRDRRCAVTGARRDGRTVVTNTARAHSRSTSPSRAACRGRARQHARRARCMLAGSFAEIVAGERLVNRGLMPERPFVLVCQQSLADPTRAQDDVHPVWAYAHVPSGYTGDATEALLDQIERFAPGLRERVVGKAVRTTAEIERDNANYFGGDIITGANTPWQTVIRPRLALDPYSTGIPGVFICSAATPPGAGAHGMNGYNAANRSADLGAGEDEQRGRTSKVQNRFRHEPIPDAPR